MHTVGIERALLALEDAVNAAFTAARLPRRTVAAATLGLAGAGRPEDQAFVTDWAARVRLADRVEVTGDATLLLAAGTPEGWGVAAIAGTGSMAYARAADGRTARAGGWGYLLGDEGSGYALVLAGLQAVARAVDGRGPATSLRERFLTKLNLGEAQELIPLIYRGGWDRATLAALAPVVLEAAEAGDPVASTIVGQAAGEVGGNHSRRGAATGNGNGPDTAGTGGRSASRVDKLPGASARALAVRGVQPASVHLVAEPAEGALKRAGAARDRKGRPGGLSHDGDSFPNSAQNTIPPWPPSIPPPVLRETVVSPPRAGRSSPRPRIVPRPRGMMPSPPCAAPTWYPLYAFIRRRGYAAHEAQDLTQGFFAFLLEQESLALVDRARGRFRSFLLASCAHFLSHQRERGQAKKRGGGRSFVSLDFAAAEGRDDREPADHQTPEKLFDRRWALTLLNQVFARLRGEFAARGKGLLFERLRVFLLGEKSAGPYADVAEEFGMTEGAIKVAAHRLRQRFREVLREEIARTVDDSEQVEDEIRELFAALAG